MGTRTREHEKLNEENKLNEAKRIANFVELAMGFGFTPERALFLAKCSHTEDNIGDGNKRYFIPYDPMVQIMEASRIGISLSDTAEMMGMSVEELSSLGVQFSPNTKLVPPNGRASLYHLLSPEYTRKTKRKKTWRRKNK